MGASRLAKVLDILAAHPRPRITVIRAGGLGDTILLLPALQILREELPGMQLTLVGSRWAEALQLLLPFPHRTVRFDSPKLAALFAAPASDDASGVFATSDAIILYTDNRASDFVQNAVRHCPGPVLVWPASTIRGMHAAVHYARAITGEPVDLEGLPIPVLRVPPDPGARGRRWLDAQLGVEVRPMAIHPGSGGHRKCWPPAAFAELILRLNIPTLLIEGPADAEACREVAERLDPALPVARAADLSLADLAAVLGECCLYVGNDSGVSHLAAALGVLPTTVVFGPTDPAVWRPLGCRVDPVQPANGIAWPTAADALATVRSLQVESSRPCG